jgi:hypothetical protein
VASTVLAATVAGCAAGLATTQLDGGQGRELTAEERSWNCGNLENAISARITRIVVLRQMADYETTHASPTLSNLLTRLTAGAGAASPSLEKIPAERAAADAYNAALAAKSCPRIDIDAKIASANPPPLPPQPVAPAKPEIEVPRVR